MRQRFEQQTRLGVLPISEVEFTPGFLKSRDELPPVLMALHNVFMNKELNEKVFQLLETNITHTAKTKGRKGMDLWHIIVLSVIRHTLGANWDRLLYVANFDIKTREVLGVYSSSPMVESIEFKYQTLIDNVSLIKEETLIKLNDIIVEYGDVLFKKKASEICNVQLKTDSYVLETNVHFPTDLNLLWDAVRKSFDIVEKAHDWGAIAGWRKVKSLRVGFKSLYRNSTNKIYKSKKEEIRLAGVQDYITAARTYIPRFISAVETLKKSQDDVLQFLGEELELFVNYAIKLSDQIERRLVKNEVIDPSEKIYSLFEPHTEWIYKGKSNHKVELGHQLLITSNQNNMIVDYKVMEKEKDASQVNSLMDRLVAKFGKERIRSISFDKGFWSKENFEYASSSIEGLVVMPKKGKKNLEEIDRESTKEYKTLRNKHSAIESNINMLEHHGLGKCRDKGIRNYKKYVGLSVLAMNLHLIGNEIKRQQKEKEEKEFRKKTKQALRRAA
jgi:transposase, IS5 family